MTIPPPVWLLDIDGVLNAVTKTPDPNVWPLDRWSRGEASDGETEWPILFARPVADFLRQVHEEGRAEIRWHTTWQQEAGAVGKLLDLPAFPVQPSPEWAVQLRGETEEWWKIGAALRVAEAEGRSLVWTDDDAGSRHLRRRVRARLTSVVPCLIVVPSPRAGLTPKHLRKIDAFLTRVAS
ncbi:hypothetical protein I0C86_11055 [Plantactinospora sp. S1510]|uniref:Secreted protein n=1 Tax=Plantactinospora alkalitolerans TaxID=2789879 RepID=A0ABS0GTH8_9ACTN|nr:hypothetical protein [Plantactinospora alkalitolerans]MBF9129500.1 hypothetical protein [Plantactinospora alkalitolerans]